MDVYAVTSTDVMDSVIGKKGSVEMQIQPEMLSPVDTSMWWMKSTRANMAVTSHPSMPVHW